MITLIGWIYLGLAFAIALGAFTITLTTLAVIGLVTLACICFTRSELGRKIK